jgi:TM2 domain-containing membrane protein YozV
MTTPPPGQDPYYDPYQQQPLPAPYSPADAYPVTPYQQNPYPYGLEPLTGLPYSDKSKIVAGLLQLLPGFLMGLGGIGRLYAGNTTIGIVQLAATVVGWISFWCGFVTLVSFAFFGLIWLWFVIDGIVIMAGRVTDGQGRPLRT